MSNTRLTLVFPLKTQGAGPADLQLLRAYLGGNSGPKTYLDQLILTGDAKPAFAFSFTQNSGIFSAKNRTNWILFPVGLKNDKGNISADSDYVLDAVKLTPGTSGDAPIFHALGGAFCVGSDHSIVGMLFQPQMTVPSDYPPACQTLLPEVARSAADRIEKHPHDITAMARAYIKEPDGKLTVRKVVPTQRHPRDVMDGGAPDGGSHDAGLINAGIDAGYGGGGGHHNPSESHGSSDGVPFFLLGGGLACAVIVGSIYSRLRFDRTHGRISNTPKPHPLPKGSAPRSTPEATVVIEGRGSKIEGSQPPSPQSPPQSPAPQSPSASGPVSPIVIKPASGGVVSISTGAGNHSPAATLRKTLQASPQRSDTLPSEPGPVPNYQAQVEAQKREELKKFIESVIYSRQLVDTSRENLEKAEKELADFNKSKSQDETLRKPLSDAVNWASLDLESAKGKLRTKFESLLKRRETDKDLIIELLAQINAEKNTDYGLSDLKVED